MSRKKNILDTLQQLDQEIREAQKSQDDRFEALLKEAKEDLGMSEKKDPTVKMFFGMPIRADDSLEFYKEEADFKGLFQEVKRLNGMSYVKKLIRLLSCEKEIERLASYLFRNYGEEIGRESGETAVAVAIRLLEERRKNG